MFKVMVTIFSIPLLAQADFNINFKPLIARAAAQEQHAAVDQQDLQVAAQTLASVSQMNGATDPQFNQLMQNVHSLTQSQDQ